jgi:hypothetical protein
MPIFNGQGYNIYSYPVMYFKLPRYGQTVNGTRSMYILTDVGYPFICRKPGFVKINKETGDVTAAVLTRDRTPLYDLDEEYSNFYYVKDDNTVVCIEL